MSEALAAILDLDLAWRRVKADIASGREFVRHPYEVELIDADLAEWLQFVRQQVTEGFNPLAPLIVDVPKGAGAVRPGVLLPTEDRLVYAACLGLALPAIYSSLQWSQGTVDFAYQLAKDHNKPEWLKKAFVAWRAFRERSLQKLGDGVTHIVITDITGYYENIDIGTLVSDLRQIGVHPGVVQLLSACLNRWSLGNGRGIPQGMSPSDILTKLYLNSVDLSLKESGFDHIRYVDDIRIFCHSEVEAKRALLKLIQLLRRRGLNLQSAKTRIIRTQEAVKLFEAIIPIIKGVRDEFIRTIVEQAGYEGAYITLAEADQLAAENPVEASTEILKEVFDRYFIHEDIPFNATLFRFILGRMGHQRDAYCRDYCLSILPRHPEETSHILNYFSYILEFEYSLLGLHSFLSSDHAIYCYQIYQIFEWINSIEEHPIDALASRARDLAFDNSKPIYLRATTRKLIGRFGTFADLEQIEASYASISLPLERAQILCDLRRMEAGRRNAFLGRSTRDHLLCARAARLVRDGRL